MYQIKKETQRTSVKLIKKPLIFIFILIVLFLVCFFLLKLFKPFVHSNHKSLYSAFVAYSNYVSLGAMILLGIIALIFIVILIATLSETIEWKLFMRSLPLSKKECEINNVKNVYEYLFLIEKRREEICLKWFHDKFSFYEPKITHEVMNALNESIQNIFIFPNTLDTTKLFTLPIKLSSDIADAYLQTYVYRIAERDIISIEKDDFYIDYIDIFDIEINLEYLHDYWKTCTVK